MGLTWTQSDYAKRIFNLTNFVCCHIWLQFHFWDTIATKLFSVLFIQCKWKKNTYLLYFYYFLNPAVLILQCTGFLTQKFWERKMPYLLSVTWLLVAAFLSGLHRSSSLNAKELQSARSVADLIDQCHCLGAKAEITICHDC